MCDEGVTETVMGLDTQGWVRLCWAVLQSPTIEVHSIILEHNEMSLRTEEENSA